MRMFFRRRRVVPHGLAPSEECDRVYRKTLHEMQRLFHLEEERRKQRRAA
jgi:hypothetical protein